MRMGSGAPNPAGSLGAGGFGTTKKPGLSGSSDTRSTPENDNKIPERRFCACHQLWGQDGLSFPEGVSGWGAKGEQDLGGIRKLALQK